jgi:hypothetical protein
LDLSKVDISPTTLGSLTSTSSWVSQSESFKNSPCFGNTPHNSLFKMMCQTLLFRSSPHVGPTLSCLHTMPNVLELFPCTYVVVWNAWFPPKCKIFSCLIIQNGVWTANHLESRGCPNGRFFPYVVAIMNRFPTSYLNAATHPHLEYGQGWIHIHDFDPSSRSGFDNVEHWWTSMAFSHGARRNAMTSLLMLVS